LGGNLILLMHFETLMNESESLLALLQDIISKSTKDWTANETDATLYGIIKGWDITNIPVLQTKFRWNADQIKKIRDMHTEFKQAQFSQFLQKYNIIYERDKEMISTHGH